MKEDFGDSAKPVEDNCGVPPPVRVPGQIVNGQLFVKVNVAELAPVFMKMNDIFEI